jgi:hypothetical protein
LGKENCSWLTSAVFGRLSIIVPSVLLICSSQLRCATKPPLFASSTIDRKLDSTPWPIEIAAHICAHARLCSHVPIAFLLSPAFVLPRRPELLASIEREKKLRGKSLITQEQQIGLHVPCAAVSTAPSSGAVPCPASELILHPKLYPIILASFPQMHHGRSLQINKDQSISS